MCFFLDWKFLMLRLAKVISGSGDQRWSEIFCLTFYGIVKSLNSSAVVAFFFLDGIQYSRLMLVHWLNITTLLEHWFGVLIDFYIILAPVFKVLEGKEILSTFYCGKVKSPMKVYPDFLGVMHLCLLKVSRMHYTAWKN